ncbi:cytochrome P450 [Xylariales sp. PMI_506]|nr:cytochrome P450 [Xylariales sp. PMI_506]
MLEHLLQVHPFVLASCVVVAAAFLFYNIFKASTLPDLPIVGARPGEWFSISRARWRNARDMPTATRSAYKQYRHQTCILPIAGGSDTVLLPIEQLPWLLEQPDTVVSIEDQIRAALQLDYTIPDHRLWEEPVHQPLIVTTLTRETNNLIPDLYDEVSSAVDQLWGTEKGTYVEIPVWEVMQRIIGRATNRVFVGAPLCRDEELLKTGIACARHIPVTAMILRFVWGPLRPLVALFATIPGRVVDYKFYRILKPEIQRRLAEYDAQRSDLESNGGASSMHASDNGSTPATIKNDFLQWSIHQAKAAGEPYLYKPRTLAGRIMLLNFASIHTSSFAITHVLFDLASCAHSPEGLHPIDELRAEIAQVLAAHRNQWNKRSLAEMTKLDSVMRESQRINSFVTVATHRLVIGSKGITTPSGIHLKPGTLVGAPSFPVFHDGDIYEDPDQFKPFRFAEKRMHNDDIKRNRNGDYIQRARQAWATTSPEYTAFGHGRHACPGRFFASSELKLMLAYLIMNYDLEALKKRPDNVWFGLNRVPPLVSTLKVRRRT